MAQPQTAGVWTSSSVDSDAQRFVDVLRDPRWIAITVDFAYLEEEESGAMGAAPMGVAPIGGGITREIPADRMTTAAGRDGHGFVSTLFIAIRNHTLASFIRATLHTGAESSEEFFMTFTENEGEPWSANLTFGDGSVATAYPPEDLSETSGTPRDHPSRWLEPVEPDEYGAVESLIGEFQKLLDETVGIADETRLRLQGAIDVLRGSHRAVEIGVTRRIELISVVKSAFTYIRKELPRDVVAWAGAIKVVETMYPTLADQLRALFT